MSILNIEKFSLLQSCYISTVMFYKLACCYPWSNHTPSPSTVTVKLQFSSKVLCYRLSRCVLYMVSLSFVFQDNVIYERLAEGQEHREDTLRHLEQFASEGN